MKWPRVHGEFRTMREVLAGRSLARYGDGELKIAHGAGYSREPANPALTAELAAILKNHDPRCLVAVPTMVRRGPKYPSWARHAERFAKVLDLEHEYGSAFVSRPDSAPWIECPTFGRMVDRLWQGKRAVVVCEEGGSMLGAVRRSAAQAVHVVCPHQKAYAVIDELERAVCELAPEIAILSAGPTATALAYRLARAGVHAVDLGSAGKFLQRVLP